jgi:hypothetical protein
MTDLVASSVLIARGGEIIGVSARLLQSIYAIAAVVLLVTTADLLYGGFEPGLAEVALCDYTEKSRFFVTLRR